MFRLKQMFLAFCFGAAGAFVGLFGYGSVRCQHFRFPASFVRLFGSPIRQAEIARIWLEIQKRAR